MCYFEGVESKINNNGILTIIIESNYIDTFPKILFNKIKTAFPEAKSLTLNGILFKEQFSEIHVLVKLGNSLMPGGMIIKNRNFLIYDEAETFIQRIEPITENQSSITDKNPKNSAIKIFANLESFSLLFKHSTQVNFALKLLSDTYKNDVIYNDWVSKMTALFCVILNAISEDLQYIFNNVDSDIVIAESKYLQIIEAIRITNDNTVELAKSCNFDECLTLMKNLRQIISNYLDLLPIEAFNL